MARYTIDVGDKFDGIITELAKEEDTTKSEIIRRSVAVYGLLKSEVKDRSKRVAIVASDGTVLKEVVIP